MRRSHGTFREAPFWDPFWEPFWEPFWAHFGTLDHSGRGPKLAQTFIAPWLASVACPCQGVTRTPFFRHPGGYGRLERSYRAAL